jgi:uncharacterized protein (DUF4415 family)
MSKNRIEYTSAPPAVAKAMAQAVAADGNELFPNRAELLAAIKKAQHKKITLNIDTDLLEFYKADAKKNDVPYQRYITEVLRQYANRVTSF